MIIEDIFTDGSKIKYNTEIKQFEITINQEDESDHLLLLNDKKDIIRLNLFMETIMKYI